MAGNEAFMPVQRLGWSRGLGNLLDHEFSRWWGTRMWWIQVLIWVGITGFMLVAVVFGSGPFVLSEGVMLYCIFAGLFPAVGVVIIMQDVLVGEKSQGTAAWVLSKPVSRSAFILSKLASGSLGVFVTMVLCPGLVAYTMLSLANRAALDPLRFLAAMGVIFLAQWFFLTFTLMLGALFPHRGPVIGGALALLFLQQYLVGLVPPLRYVLPWMLVIPLNNQSEAIAPALILGTPVFSYLPLVCILLESLVFVGIAIRRFEREEL